MDFELSDDLVALQEMARRFAAEIIAPHAREWDRNADIPRDVVVATKAAEDAEKVDLPVEDVSGDMNIFDIGKVTIERYKREIEKAKTQDQRVTMVCMPEKTVMSWGTVTPRLPLNSTLRIITRHLLPLQPLLIEFDLLWHQLKHQAKFHYFQP